MEHTFYQSWYSYDLVRLYGFIIMFLLEAVLTIGQYGMSKGEYWIVFLTALLDIDLSHDTASMLFYGIVAVSGLVSYYRIKRYLDRSDLVERSLGYLNSKITLVLFGSFIFHVFTGDPISRIMLNVCLAIVTFWMVRGIMRAGRGRGSSDDLVSLSPEVGDQPQDPTQLSEGNIVTTGRRANINRHRKYGYHGGAGPYNDGHVDPNNYDDYLD